ncbi:MAG: tetratricopeptide repeat protein [Chitinispirillaceae bacterium]|nr:tetratricopeptide repeat protein [Chitinispirillaceae bacterium]
MKQKIFVITAAFFCAILMSACRDSRLSAANTLLENGDYISARAAYSRIVEKQPGHFAARYGLGMSFSAEAMHKSELGLAGPDDWYDAIYHLTVAAHLDTGREVRRTLAILHYNLGASQKKIGADDDAILRIGQAIAYDSTLLKAYNMLGALYHEQGEFENAESCYRRTLILKPDYSMAHFNLGALCMARGQYDDAVGHFIDAAALEPENRHFQSWLGQARTLAGRR